MNPPVPPARVFACQAQDEDVSLSVLLIGSNPRSVIMPVRESRTVAEPRWAMLVCFVSCSLDRAEKPAGHSSWMGLRYSQRSRAAEQQQQVSGRRSIR